MSGGRIHFEAVPPANPLEVSSKARALVSEVAAGLRFENGMNVGATLEASVIAHSLFSVVKILPMTEADARAACDAAVATLTAQGFLDDPRPDGQA